VGLVRRAVRVIDGFTKTYAEGVEIGLLGVSLRGCGLRQSLAEVVNVFL